MTARSFCLGRACPGHPERKHSSHRDHRDKPGDDTKILQPAALAREVKFLPEPPAAVAEDGVFEGYASLFGIADLGKDVISPGAFADSLARRGAGGVRMLWQHDPAEPIGRWLSIAEDARGLRVRGQLNLAVERARELRALMTDGAVDGLSIGFRVERARADKRAGLRRLERVDLWEISLVTFPMLPGARVSAVKGSRLNTSPRTRGEAESRKRPGEGAYPEEPHPETPPHPRPTGSLHRPVRRCSPLPAPRGEAFAAHEKRGLALAIRRAAARLFNA